MTTELNEEFLATVARLYETDLAFRARVEDMRRSIVFPEQDEPDVSPDPNEEQQQEPDIQVGNRIDITCENGETIVLVDGKKLDPLTRVAVDISSETRCPVITLEHLGKELHVTGTVVQIGAPSAANRVLSHLLSYLDDQLSCPMEIGEMRELAWKIRTELLRAVRMHGVSLLPPA